MEDTGRRKSIRVKVQQEKESEEEKEKVLQLKLETSMSSINLRKSARFSKPVVVTTISSSSTSAEDNDDEVQVVEESPNKRRRVNSGGDLSPLPSTSSNLVNTTTPGGTIWRFNSIGVPECPLPCRESQFEEIWSFLNENITEKNSRYTITSIRFDITCCFCINYVYYYVDVCM